MTRKASLELIKYAGYHQDTKTMVRTYIENHISYTAAQEAYQQGYLAKQAGIKCGCAKCTPTNN